MVEFRNQITSTVRSSYQLKLSCTRTTARDESVRYLFALSPVVHAEVERRFVEDIKLGLRV